MICFGPISSRRLGKSLGINNITSPKVCSYNCVYCQVGKTVNSTIVRRQFFKPSEILNEIKKHLSKLDDSNYPDYLTFVSNGEPTLDINLGKSIETLKVFGIPVAVITNASLLIYEQVRKELRHADWVSIKIDAADNSTWRLINRPLDNLKFREHIEAINLFTSEYTGVLCTETMLIDKLNDPSYCLKKIAAVVKRVQPFKAYISIPIRPPAVSYVKSPSLESLNKAYQIFNEFGIDTELLTGFEGTDTGYTGNIINDILNITAVHPLREDSLIELLNKDKADYSVVESLINQKLIKVVLYQNKKYYLRNNR